ncbi:MAG: hypothetical protein C4321_00335 [Chloroflexota bacterium]
MPLLLRRFPLSDHALLIFRIKKKRGFLAFLHFLPAYRADIINPDTTTTPADEVAPRQDGSNEPLFVDEDGIGTALLHRHADLRPASCPHLLALPLLDLSIT